MPRTRIAEKLGVPLSRLNAAIEVAARLDALGRLDDRARYDLAAVLTLQPAARHYARAVAAIVAYLEAAP